MAFDDHAVAVAERARLLDEACKAHIETMLHAIRGNGIDRHMLGMLLHARESGMPLPALFTNPLFVRSKTWRLSTSQLSSNLFEIIFGAVESNGLGVWYGLRDTWLDVNVAHGPEAPVQCETFAFALDHAVRNAVDLLQRARLASRL